MRQHIRNARGFTFVELMVVVAIIGILSAVALPAYYNYLLRTRQADGAQKLLDIKIAQEKYYTLNDKYSNAAAAADFTPLLSFDVADTTYYSFTIATTNETVRYQAIARGDLNGDGVRRDCWEITESLSKPQVYNDAVCTGDEGFSFSVIANIL